jgi:hypothetical protein
LTDALIAEGARAMGTSVYLKLKDGRSLPLKEGADSASAAVVKAHFEEWLRNGITLSVTDAQGKVEDITPRRVVAIEMIDTPER